MDGIPELKFAQARAVNGIEVLGPPPAPLD